MARAAVLGRLHDNRKIPNHSLSNHPLIDRWNSFMPANLCAKREHLILIIDHGRTINGSHSPNRIYGPAHGAFPLPATFLLLFNFMPKEIRKRRERGSDRVEN